MKRLFLVMSLLLTVPSYAGVYNYSADDAEVYDASDRDKRRKRRDYITHVVGIGETVYSILVRYGLPLNVLRADNDEITDDLQLKPGQTLFINKSAMGSATESQIATQVNAAVQPKEPEKEPVVTEEVKKDVAQDDSVTTSGEVILVDRNGFVHHTVSEGETLFWIGRTYDVPVPVIREKNADKLTDGLIIGTTLMIPLDRAVIESGQIYGRPIRVMDGDFEKYEGVRPAKNFGVGLQPVNVAMLLPMTVDGIPQKQFSEFYQGALVALDSIKREGVSVNLTLYDTKRDSSEVYRIVSSGEIADVDLIIGPVYDDMFPIVADYARARKIPVVSPLGDVDCDDNPYVFQMKADEEYHYDKLDALVSGKHIVVMTTGDDDEDFINYIKSRSSDVRLVAFNRTAKPDVLLPYMPYGKETLFIVAANSRVMADQVVSKLVGLRSLTAGRRDMSVVASSKIARMDIDPLALFKLGISYVTTYHIDRSDYLVRKFDGNYIRLFGNLPSLYAYKGYDITMFFLGTMVEMGSDFRDYMDNYYTTILRSRYKIKQLKPDGKFVNTEWILVTYDTDYSIDVE